MRKTSESWHTQLQLNRTITQNYYLDILLFFFMNSVLAFYFFFSIVFFFSSSTSHFLHYIFHRSCFLFTISWRKILIKVIKTVFCFRHNGCQITLFTCWLILRKCSKFVLPHNVTSHFSWKFSGKVEICVKPRGLSRAKSESLEYIHTYIRILYFLSNFKELKLSNIFENMNRTQYNSYQINMLKNYEYD